MRMRRINDRINAINGLRIDMEQALLDAIGTLVGGILFVYAALLLQHQKVWIRKTFSWESKEEYPKIYLVNVVGSILIGSYLIFIR